MKKLLISMALAIAGWMTFSSSAATVKLNSPIDCTVFGISENGNWALGMQGNSISDYYTFRWNLVTNEVEVSGKISECGTSIANDGTYCGGFRYTDENGRSFIAPGYYDGEWHVLPMPEGKVSYALDGSISPDGRHMAITIEHEGVYKVVQYEDKKLVRVLHSDNDHSRGYTISNDGRYIGGWTNAHIPGVTVNRTGVYWEGDSEYKLIDGDDDPKNAHRSPWAGVKRFTSDNKYALFYGGWIQPKVGDPYILGIKDLETLDISPILPPDGEGHEFSADDMADDLTLVGSYNGAAVIIKDSKAQYFVDWLKAEKGIDAKAEWNEVMTYNGSFLLERATCIQRNGKAIGLIYNGSDMEMHSMVLKFDVNVDNAAPATVRLSKVEKLNAIRVKWVLPYGVDMTKVKGFNVYRDGEKVNDTPLAGDHFFDTGLASGKTYSYEVTAIYDEGESEKSPAVTFAFEEDKPEAPTSFLARQRGLNSVILTWNEPATNLVQKSYFEQNSLTQGFGVSEVGTVIEAGVKFDADEMALYGNARITAVEFYPMSKQSDWKVSIYAEDAAGSLERLVSYDITQELSLRERNIFRLPEVLDVPAGKNIIAAVSSRAVDEMNIQNIIGMQFEKSTQGYSDLLRRVMEPAENFQSLAVMAQGSGMNMLVSWKISLVLTPEGTSSDLDVVDKYAVTRDGQEIYSSTGRTYIDKYLADNSYKYGIKAIYADGRISPEVTANQTVVARAESCIPAEDVTVNVNDKTLDVAWKAPVDNDRTDVTYAHGNLDPKTQIQARNNKFNLQAAAIYPTTMFSGLDSYNIVGARFYPTAEATYTIIVDKGVGTRELVYYEVPLYKKNEWNTVYFDEPVKVDANTNYRLVVDCYDVEDNGSPLAVDDCEGLDGFSCLINVTEGSEQWQEVSAQIGKSCNWMMGLILTDNESMPLPIEGYDVKVDGTKINSALVTDTKYSHPVAELTPDGKKHALTVETWYKPFSTAVASEAVMFVLDNSGINENTIADIVINKNGTMINVTGGVTGIEIFNLNGVRVAAADGDVISVDNLAAGVYVLKAASADKVVVTKINIR